MGYPSLFRECAGLATIPVTNTLLLPLGSEEMSLVQLYIPTEVAHDTISELGVMGNFQFKDVSDHSLISVAATSYQNSAFVVEWRSQRVPAIIRWRDSSTGRDGTTTPPIPESNYVDQSADRDHSPFSRCAIHVRRSSSGSSL